MSQERVKYSLSNKTHERTPRERDPSRIFGTWRNTNPIKAFGNPGKTRDMLQSLFKSYVFSEISEQAQKLDCNQPHRSTGIYFYYVFIKENRNKTMEKKSHCIRLSSVFIKEKRWSPQGQGSVYPLLIQSFLLGIFQQNICHKYL